MVQMDSKTDTNSLEELELYKSNVINFLSSSRFDGIGEKTARKIYDVLDISIIRQWFDGIFEINKFKDKLDFLTEKQFNALQDGVLDIINHPLVSSDTMFRYGFTDVEIKLIQDKYRDNVDYFLSNDLYILVKDFRQFTLSRVDKIAKGLGYDFYDVRRLTMAIYSVANQMMRMTGDTYVPLYLFNYKGTDTGLIAKVVTKLNSSAWEPKDVAEVSQKLKELLSKLAKEGSIRKISNSNAKKVTHIMTGTMYDYEETIASELLYRAFDKTMDAPGKDIDNAYRKVSHIYKTQEEYIRSLITEVEESIGIKYDDNQIDGILNAVMNKVFILVGGPGTGKTTILRGILEVYFRLLSDFSKNVDVSYVDYINKLISAYDKYRSSNNGDRQRPSDEPPITLVAPTGKAAQRMTESTGIKASTVHRALGLFPQSREPGHDFLGKLVVIDEASMADTYLMSMIVSALPEDARLIIVGDSDQLPSVGPGQVLQDLLRCGYLPSKRLTKIYRQGENSRIVTLAKAINEGHLTNDFDVQSETLKFVPVDTDEGVQHRIINIVDELRTKGYTFDDIKILSPMRKHPHGVTALNAYFQKNLNPFINDADNTFPGFNEKFAKTDIVMNTANMATEGIYNGDVGKVAGLVSEKPAEDEEPINKLLVKFDINGTHKSYVYDYLESSNLTLAYAMTIHKSQGSEYPVVIVPMTSSFRFMYARNLLYTAITRAKQVVYLVGSKQAFADCAAHIGTNRKTLLVERFVEQAKKLKDDNL